MVLDHKRDFRPAYWLQAKSQFCRGDDAEGLQTLNALLSRDSQRGDSQSVEARSARGRALRELAVDLDPTSRRRVLLLALTELESARFDGAATGDDVTAAKDLLGRAAEVVEVYSVQLAAAPEDTATRKKRAWDYVTLKQYDLAAADFQDVLRLSPEDPEGQKCTGHSSKYPRNRRMQGFSWAAY
jgi:tetratricopeptide (TPR) repeat protein